MQRISIICNNPSWHPYWDRGENRTVPKIPRGIGYKIRNGCSDLVHGPTRACPAPLRKAGAPGHAWDTHPHPHTPPGQQQHPPAGPRCPHGRRDGMGEAGPGRGEPPAPPHAGPARPGGRGHRPNLLLRLFPAFLLCPFFPFLGFPGRPPQPVPPSRGAAGGRSSTQLPRGC